LCSLLIGVHRTSRDSIPRSLGSQRTTDGHYGTMASSLSSPRPTRLPTHVGEVDEHSSRMGTPRSRLMSFLSSFIRPALRKTTQSTEVDGSDPNLERGSTTNTITDDTRTFWSEGIPSQNLPVQEIYFIGLIDILQRYTLFKKIERGIKGANVHLLGGMDSNTLGQGDTASHASAIARRTLLTSTWSNAVSDMFERSEHSVEEPGRYAERLVEFVRAAIA
jgi:hypothetical protein